MSKEPQKRMMIDTSDQEMAQATFAAIMAAMKGDDKRAADLLRSMGDKMLDKFAPVKEVGKRG